MNIEKYIYNLTPLRKGITGLCKDIAALIARQKRRKNINEPLIATLTKDLEKYENGLNNPASDRYMALFIHSFS